MAPVPWTRHVARSLPQAASCGRIVLGAAAIVTTGEGRWHLAATFITLGAVLDGVDGYLARRLGAEGPFGALLDYFADYLCFLVAPWALTRALMGPALPLAADLLIGLPLVTGAARYALNARAVTNPDRYPGDLPGLGTVFFAFVSVTAVFLDGPTRMATGHFQILILVAVPLLSVPMVAPIRYPKLVRFRGAAPLVVLLLTLMPFAFTRALAFATVVIGVLYALVAPLAARLGEHRAHPTGDGRG